MVIIQIEKDRAFGNGATIVGDLAEVFAYPQAVHRGLRARASHPLKPDLDVIRSPLNFSETPITEYRAPPRLGEHTHAVLAEDLGLDAAAIAYLAAEGVVSG